LQFSTRRYRAFAYWSLAYAIAIAGTGFADFQHLDLHIPYIGTTLLWAAILAAVFFVWQRNEGTLSIHSITTQRREGYYWFGLNSIAAFWMAYIVTRPLGASFSDWISKPASLTGLGFGNGRTAIVFGVAVFVAVSYLAITRPDIQRAAAASAEDERRASTTPEYITGELELE
jgi:uncharacterized membrane-anchored protein